MGCFIRFKKKLVIGIVVIIFITQILIILFGTLLQLSIIASDSMDPTLSKGDVLVWVPTKIEEIDVGDIVVFKSYIKWPDEKLIAHRVTNIKMENPSGELVFETKGDSNEWEDQNNPHIKMPFIREKNIKGKVVCFNNQPLKININFLIISLVIFTILLTFLYQYKPNKSRKENFLLKI